MQLQISHRQATRPEWDACARSCGHATFFHTPQWADLICSAWPGKMHPGALRCEFSDGAVAIIPLARHVKFFGLLTTWVSSPAQTYGGWISSLPLTEEHSRILIQFLLSYRNSIWRENPFDPLLPRIEIPRSSESFSQVLDIRNRTIDEIIANADHSHRKAVRKALGAGITVRFAQDERDWREHYAMHLQSRARWKNKRIPVGLGYSESFFLQCAQVNSDNMRLWVASHNGKPAASVICCYYGHHAVSWHGAGREEFFALRPNNLLYQEMIRDAIARGFWWFDMNPTGGFGGVEKFKEHLGAQKMRSRIIVRTPVCVRIFKKLLGK